MAKFVDKPADQHVREIIDKIRRGGGGTAVRDQVLGVWKGKARQAGIPRERQEIIIATVKSMVK